MQLLEAKAKKDLRGSELKKFRKFQKYFRKEWIVKVGVEELSVHGHEIKATSGLESFNRKFNSMSPNKRPPFWKLLRDFLSIKDLREDLLAIYADPADPLCSDLELCSSHCEGLFGQLGSRQFPLWSASNSNRCFS